ncbi:glycosyltransferase family 4 protein [Mariniflexile sp.]|uniref:glycosyltransferase family 4 protein n=1 Tax=Mariniflexile sp. TaxID=1979402 RepID=UPI004048C525
MKQLLYIGNHLSKAGKTETTIEILGKALRVEGFTVHTVSNKKNKVWRLLEMLFAILKFYKKADYVLMDTYSTSNFYYAYLCGQLCRFLKLKYIPILHGGNLPNRLRSSPRLSDSLFKNAHINVAPSLYMQSEFEKMGYSNLVYIPNFIEIKNYPFKKRRFETVKLLWVRSFSEIYNPLLAIKILKLLLDEGIPATLTMVGPDNDGSLLKAEKYAEGLGVEINFTGKLSKESWIELSKNHNIFINTTNFDNMPVSVIEAMALGLPIISTNMGGLPYLIENEKDGVLVKPNNAALFVEAIKKLQAHSDVANAMAFTARNKVANFDWEIVKKQWIRVLPE